MSNKIFLLIFIIFFNYLHSGDWNKCARNYNLLKIVENEKVPFDIYVNSNDKEKVGFHKLILGSFNPYFNMLIFNENFQTCDEVFIDLSKINLEKFRQYVYGAHYSYVFENIDIRDLCDFFRLGHLMNSEKIQRFTSELIIFTENISDENILYLIDLSVLYTNEKILKHALKLIRDEEDETVIHVWQKLFEDIAGSKLLEIILNEAKSFSNKYFKNIHVKKIILESVSNKFILDMIKLNNGFHNLHLYNYKIIGNILQATKNCSKSYSFFIDTNSDDCLPIIENRLDGIKLLDYDASKNLYVGRKYVLPQHKLVWLIINENLSIEIVDEIDFEFPNRIKAYKLDIKNNLIFCQQKKSSYFVKPNLTSYEWEEILSTGCDKNFCYGFNQDANWLAVRQEETLYLINISTKTTYKISVKHIIDLVLGQKLFAILQKNTIDIFSFDTLDLVDVICVGSKLRDVSVAIRDNDNEILIIKHNKQNKIKSYKIGNKIFSDKY